LLGLVGVVSLLSSLVALHLMISGFDWINDYASDLANQPYGGLFVAGTIVHGLGNLSLSLGLRAALRPGRLRTWAVLLFGLAAAGLVLSALFPTDSAGQVSMAGRIHRTVVSLAFAFELAALFVFSDAFRQNRRWRSRRPLSLALSSISAVAVTLFVIAVQVDIAPGLAERLALSAYMSWELWVIYQLIQGGRMIPSCAKPP